MVEIHIGEHPQSKPNFEPVFRLFETHFIDVDRSDVGNGYVFRQIRSIWDGLCSLRSKGERLLTYNVDWNGLRPMTSVEDVWFSRENIFNFFGTIVDWVNSGVPRQLGADALYDVFVHNDITLSQFRTNAQSPKARVYRSIVHRPYIVDSLTPDALTRDAIFSTAMTHANHRRRSSVLLPEWQTPSAWSFSTMDQIHRQIWAGLKWGCRNIETISPNRELIMAAGYRSGNELFHSGQLDSDPFNECIENAIAHCQLMTVMTAIHLELYRDLAGADDQYVTTLLSHQFWSSLVAFLSLDDDDQTDSLLADAESIVIYLKSEGIRR